MSPVRVCWSGRTCESAQPRGQMMAVAPRIRRKPPHSRDRHTAVRLGLLPSLREVWQHPVFRVGVTPLTADVGRLWDAMVMSLRSAFAWFVGAALVAAACSSGTTALTAKSTDDAWRTTALVDTRSGETFTIDDLKGKLVVIEPMAIWCSNCRIQQGEAAVALDRLGDPDIVYVSVDVDPNERAGDLAAYADGSGFDWGFVVASKEVARSLATTFGDQILSPPSTPLILIGPDGEVVDQHFGIRSADDLVELFSQYLS